MARDPKDKPPTQTRESEDYTVAQRMERRKHRNAGAIADWGACTPAKLALAIASVTKRGAAITLGYTKDGNAYFVGILSDGKSDTEYIRPSEDIDLYLDALATDFE